MSVKWGVYFLLLSPYLPVLHAHSDNMQDWASGPHCAITDP